MQNVSLTVLCGQQKLTWSQIVVLFAALTVSELLPSRQDSLSAVLLKIRLSFQFLFYKVFFSNSFPPDLASFAAQTRQWTMGKNKSLTCCRS